METNILIFTVRPRSAEDLAPAERWVAEARREGLLASAMDARQVRLVTHRDLDRAAIDRAIEILRRLG